MARPKKGSVGERDNPNAASASPAAGSRSLRKGSIPASSSLSTKRANIPSFAEEPPSSDYIRVRVIEANDMGAYPDGRVFSRRWTQR